MGLRDFCAAKVTAFVPAGGKALDFGCGAGELVQLMLDRGIDAYGCDVFFEGGDYSKSVPTLLAERHVFRMHDEKIPFPDDYFDVVISNQVLEHVEGIRKALSEIARVLKPGGASINFFPSREVWYEGHCGVPLLHRFSKGNFRSRFAYAYAMRCIGFGYFKGERTNADWAMNFCRWLDDWTYYRPYNEIRRAFTTAIGPPIHFEEECFDWKVGHGFPLPTWSKRLIVRRGAGLAFFCTKCSAGSS